MSIKSKIAAIAAASIGMVLTQSSSPRAETEDNSAPEKVTKIAAHLDEEILYSALSDDVLEKAATEGFGACISPNTMGCGMCGGHSQSIKKPPSGGFMYEDRKVPPKGNTGLTVPPKPTQGNKNK
jgi:hypothetical protein